MKQVLYIFAFVFLLLCTACAKKDRNGILSERAMVDVLYDYQLALALADNSTKTSEAAQNEYLYTKAVFKKHEITEEEFNLSVAHYARDPKKMLAITKKVSEKLSNEVSKTQGNMEDSFNGTRLSSDTVVVWQSNSDIVLSANGDNYHEFNIPGKNIGSGDRLVFGFKSNWAYREGSKNGYFVMRVIYDNDSVAVKTDAIREFGSSQGFGIPLSKTRKVKNVNVQLYQIAGWRTYPQILYLRDFVLWRMTTKELPADAKE